MRIIIFCLLFHSLSARALNCEALVAQLNSLKEEFTALRYENQADQERGLDREDDAITPIHDFDTLSKSDACRIRAWRAYVELAAAQSPFDGESRAGEVIAKRLAADKSLQPAYDEAIKKFPDHCRGQNLNAAVRLHTCVDQQHKPVDKCNAEVRFNFDKCIGRKD